MEDIKQLKLKRDSIRTQIFYKDKYNEDARELVKEYNELSDKLLKYGVPKSNLKYVTEEYWVEKAKTCDFVSTRNIKNPQPNHVQIVKKDSNIDSLNKGVPLETYLKETITNTIRQEFKTFKDKEPITNEYILTIAWTNDPADPIDLGYLTHYLEKFNVKCTQPISINQITMNKEEEFMLKYEYNGNEYEHNILKKSIQYILDNLYTKTEIGFFSKKIR